MIMSGCKCSMIMSGCKCSMKRMSVYERTDVDYQGAIEDTVALPEESVTPGNGGLGLSSV